MIKKAVIPAAGYGTRFLPITKVVAKELLPIIDRPTIEYIVNEAIDSGITDILLIVSSNKNAIIDYFDYNLELERVLLDKGKTEAYEMIRENGKGANIHFIRQKEQLGLGHAILQAKAFIGNDPFAVLLGDDMYVGKPKPAIRQLIDAYEDVKANVLGTIRVNKEDAPRYGMCIPKGKRQGQLTELKGVIEKPAAKDTPSLSAIGGRYVLNPEIFKYLEKQEKGVGDEIQLTDAILNLMQEQKAYSYDITGKRYDVGNKLDYIEAILDFGLESEELKEGLEKLLKGYA